jgi:hypothetical protein
MTPAQTLAVIGLKGGAVRARQAPFQEACDPKRRQTMKPPAATMPAAAASDA